MTNTEKRKGELAIFWEEMADNLPKSLERAALGDEKIFLAFKSVYFKMAEHLEQETLKNIYDYLYTHRTADNDEIVFVRFNKKDFLRLSSLKNRKSSEKTEEIK